MLRPLSFDHTLHVINITGDVFVDAAEQEQIRTSTPRSARRRLCNQFQETGRQEEFEISKIDENMGSPRGIKHDLTPNSKSRNQPMAKRSFAGKCLIFNLIV